VLARLREADQTLESMASLRSLCPGRSHATPLTELAQQLLPRDVDSEIASAFAEGLSAIAWAMAENFPGNIFWDADYMANSLLNAAFRVIPASGGARSQPLHAAALRLRETCELVVSLHELFGMRSPLSFRYSHDFLYGFDWSRWVRRDPHARRSVGPFDREFLESMRRRGHELLELIEANDPQYPKLSSKTARNPFRFSREPEAEARLHCDLAKRGLVPVETWRADAVPRYGEPFSELRAERADELGLRRA
jgi:hypothetical protein